MEEWCTDQADVVLKHRGIVVDKSDRRKLARAVAAVMQRASLALRAAAQGKSLDVVQTPYCAANLSVVGDGCPAVRHSADHVTAGKAECPRRGLVA
jgi:hypothetical protein